MRDFPDMYMPEAQGVQTPGLKAHISGMHMLQVLCITLLP